MIKAVRIVAALAVVTGTTGVAAAGGLFVPGTGPQAQGRAGAFVAKADDPSALFHNPAGFAKMDGWVVQIGVNFVDYDLTYSRAGVYEEPANVDLPWAGQAYDPVEDESSPEIGVGGFQAVPLIAVSGDVGVDNLRIGFGVYAPQAFPNRDFAPDYEFEDPNTPPPAQRYDMMSTSASTVLPSVAVAYRLLETLDVGARFSWGFGEVSAESYTWGIRNYEEWTARDGLFTVDVGDNFIPAFGFGAIFRATDNIEIGAAYASQITFDGEGNGSARLGSDLGVGDDQEFIEPENEFYNCAPGGVDQDNLKACLQLKLPRTASIGGRYILRDAAGAEKGDVEVDVKWEQWSAASDVRVIVDGKSGLTGFQLQETVLRHGFQDTISVRLGGSYNLALAGNPLGVRAGFAYDTAAAPTEWQRADLDGAAKATAALGASLTIGKIRLDVGGGYVFQPTREVPDCNPTVAMPNCPEGSEFTLPGDRNRPDPAQPLLDRNQQIQSPFNGGKYESSYLLLTLGATYYID
jgi:long-chain fatty acid transport protein